MSGVWAAAHLSGGGAGTRVAAGEGLDPGTGAAPRMCPVHDVGLSDGRRANAQASGWAHPRRVGLRHSRLRLRRMGRHPRPAHHRTRAPAEAYHAVWLSTYQVATNPEGQAIGVAWTDVDVLRIRPVQPVEVG